MGPARKNDREPEVFVLKQGGLSSWPLRPGPPLGSLGSTAGEMEGGSLSLMESWNFFHVQQINYTEALITYPDSFLKKSEIFLLFLNNLSCVGKKEDFTLKNEIFNQPSLVKCYYCCQNAFIYCRIFQQKNPLCLIFFQYLVLLKQMSKLSFVMDMLMLLLHRQFHFNEEKKRSTITFTAVKLDTKEQLHLLNGQIKVTLNKLCKVLPSVRLTQKHKHVITTFSGAEMMWCLFASRLDPKVKAWPRIRERRGASGNTNAPNARGSGWVATPGPTWDKSASSVTSMFTLISR